MSFISLADRIFETCEGSGLNDMTLTGNQTAMQAFATRLTPSSTTLVPYLLLDGSEWEFGIGTLSAGTTLQRTTVVQSSNGDAKLSLSAQTKTVLLDVPSSYMVILDSTKLGLNDPSPVRASMFVQTIAALKAETGYLNNEIAFVRYLTSSTDGKGGMFVRDNADNTAPDNFDTFRADDSASAGLWKRVRLEIQRDILEGILKINAASGVGELRVYANDLATNPNDYFGLLATASAKTLALVARMSQTSVKSFVTLYSNGDLTDKITLSDPLVLAARAASTSIPDEALAIVNGNPEITRSSQQYDLPYVKGYVKTLTDTFTTLKAMDAAALFANNDLALVRGYQAVGDQGGGIFKWISADANADDDYLYLRPTTGAASTGNGRWMRVVADPSTTLAASATPAVKNRPVFTTSGTTTITNFLNGYEGQEIMVICGGSDIQVADNGNIDNGGRAVTLSTGIAGQFSASWVNIGGVWKLKTVNLDNVARLFAGGLAESIFTIAAGKITADRAGIIAAAQSGTADDLNTITTTTFTNGTVIDVRADAGDTITIKNGSGANKLHTQTGVDFPISGMTTISFKLQSGEWYEVSRTPLGLQNRYGIINVADYWAIGDGSDETTEIQAAITAALAEGARYLYFPYGSTGVYNAPTLTNWWNLIFIGEGTLTGVSQKAVHRLSLPTHPPMWNGVTAEHLKQTMKAADEGAIKIVIVGESHSIQGSVIGGSTNRTSANSIVGHLKTKISQAYPDATITFVDLISLGSGTDQFESASITTVGGPRAWYTTGSWESYVVAENPDLVLWLLGAVDGIDNTIDTLKNIDSAITTMQAYTTTPDIILMSSVMPASYASGSYGGSTSQKEQIQTMETIRLLAHARNIGHLDFAAMTSIKRDGFNPREVYHFKTTESFSASYALQSTAWTPTVDIGVASHSLRFKVADMSLLLEAPWVHVKLGGAAGDKLLISNTRAQLWNENPSGTPVMVAEFSWSATLTGLDAEIYVSRIGANVQIGFNGDGTYEGDIAWSYYGYNARLPGNFTPTIKEEGTSTNAITIKEISYWPSKYQQYLPSMLDVEVFGTSVLGAGSGGDGDLHYSGQAVAEIVVPVIEAINWRPSHLSGKINEAVIIDADVVDGLTVRRQSANPAQLKMRCDASADFASVADLRHEGHNDAAADFLYARLLTSIGDNANTAEYGAWAAKVAYNGNDADSADAVSLALWGGAGSNPSLHVNTPISAVGTLGTIAFRGKDSAGNALQDYGTIKWKIVSNTSGSETGDIEIAPINLGATYLFRFGKVFDVNGNEIVLDSDGDTSITSDTDDQIDFKVGGADRASLTASRLQVSIDGGNSFEVLRASANPVQALLRSQVKADFADAGEVRIEAHNSLNAAFLYTSIRGGIAKGTSGDEYGTFAVNMAYAGNDADAAQTLNARLSVWTGAGFPPPNISFLLPISTVGEIGHFSIKGKDSAGNSGQNYGSLRWSIVSNTSGSESGQIEIRALHTGSNRSFKFQNGAQFGSPTGGFKGNGTLNAVAVYDDNVLLTCYGFAQENEGVVDPEEWDSYAPDEHAPAKDFIARQSNFDQSDPDDYASFWKKNGHFPNLPGRSQNYDHAKDKLSVGECGQKLIEICEMQAIHIEKLNQRLKALEAK